MRPRPESDLDRHPHTLTAWSTRQTGPSWLHSRYESRRAQFSLAVQRGFHSITYVSKRGFELPTPSEGVENLRERYLGTLCRGKEALSTETARRTVMVSRHWPDKY
jgi:hypothetical protein